MLFSLSSGRNVIPHCSVTAYPSIPGGGVGRDGVGRDTGAA